MLSVLLLLLPLLWPLHVNTDALAMAECPNQLINYQCSTDTGDCIPRLLLCDGRADCYNGEDEFQAVCDRECTNEFHYQCSTGRCIWRSTLCDSKNETNCNGEDEDRAVCDKDCTGRHTMQCSTGSCILRQQLCDGRSDRNCNGEDEDRAVCDREKTVATTLSTAMTSAKTTPTQSTPAYTKYSTPWPLRRRVKCGEPAIEPRAGGKIRGGRLAIKGSWPWQAALLIQGVHHCGAVLITRRVAVTAAHCLHKYKTLSLFSVVLGTNYWNASRAEADHYELERFVLHPDFNRPKLFSNDIALLFLKERVKLRDVVNTVCVDRDPPPARSVGVVTGWGMTFRWFNQIEKNADALRQVELPLVSAERCNQPDIYNGSVDTVSQFCAGRPGRDSCKGDSGGPLVTVGSARGWTLSGIVSWGWFCAESKYPGVYTSVSHAFQWIQTEVAAMNYTSVGDRMLCDCDSSMFIIRYTYD